MTETYADLEARHDGPIPRDEMLRARGLAPVLLGARGAARFFRERVEDATAALRGWEGSTRTDVDVALEVLQRRIDLAVMVEAYRRAQARVRLLENPTTAGLADIFGALK